MQMFLVQVRFIKKTIAWIVSHLGIYIGDWVFSVLQLRFPPWGC
jgi:hypothetical protein